VLQGFIEYPNSIGIAGTGRVAKALGQILTQKGQPVAAIAGRNPERTAMAASFIGARVSAVRIRDLPKVASRILIAASDASVEPIAALLARSGFRRGIALHTCGAKGPEALEVLASQGVSCGALHPIQSFTSTGKSFINMAGITFGIDGDPEALAWAASIVTTFGASSIRVHSNHRALYHAAAVMASNYIVALIHTAVELMQASGVERPVALKALAPLIRTSSETALRHGPIQALTGPIDRGDSATVLAHLKALKENSSRSVRALYCAAAQVAVEMAAQRGLSHPMASELENLLRLVQ
jgi:predicted short-subunit dehydrogenase-like oxidoreductase (DUF2520 family)